MISPSTETPPIPKASGKELRAKDEQREGRCDKQIRSHAEGQGGAQQAEKQGGAGEEERAIHQGERVESQEAAGQRQITPTNLRLRPAWHDEA